MTRPKQIIYPLRYLPSFLRGDARSEEGFKSDFGAFLGGKTFVIPIGRARGGIFLLVKLAVKSGRRRVIMFPYTIPDIVNMVRFAGGEPVFVDALPNSTNIDVDQLSCLISDDTACVLITHYHINQNQLGAIRALCKKRGVDLYDDCALAIGGDYAGSRIGAVTDASVFSLSGFKALNYFWGGAITTGSAKRAAEITEIVDRWKRLGFLQYQKQMLKTLKYDLATRPMTFSRVVFPLLRRRIIASEARDLLPMVRVESAFLEDTVTSRPSLGAMEEWNGKISLIDEHIRHRRRIAAIYHPYLESRMVSPETSADIQSGSCFVNYPIFTDPARRGEVYKDILARGFDVGLSLYPNVHENPDFTSVPGHSRNVSALTRSVITLPTHPRITETYALQLAVAVNDALSRNKAL